MLGGAAALSATLAAPHLARAAGASVIRFVPYIDLSLLDPVINTATPTRNHGFLVFDTLYGFDEDFVARPQMVAGHVVDDDGRRWTLTLRPGLRFHDGEPVLARDAVASILPLVQARHVRQILDGRDRRTGRARRPHDPVSPETTLSATARCTWRRWCRRCAR